jgi:hypothetical protein
VIKLTAVIMEECHIYRLQWNTTPAIDYREVYYSVRRKILYNNFTEFCTPVKAVGIIKMCLN